jgi:threonine/homoserine/homoserine lactone efflux protein
MTSLDLRHQAGDGAGMFTLIPLETLLTFASAGILLNLTPGADVMFATASGMAGGPRAGMAAGAGVGLGGFWHVGLAALGVAALLAAHPAAMTGLRWFGAGYLLYLAYSSWTAGPVQGMTGTPSLSRAFWRGFVTNALNPKVALFVLAFLPQFTDPARGPVWQQILILGAVFTATGMVITAGYGALAGLAGQALSARMVVMNKLAAGVFGLLALRMIKE